MRAWRLVPEPEMRTVMRTGATSEGEEEVITVMVVVVVVVVVTMVSMGYGAGWQYLQYRYLTSDQKKRFACETWVLHAPRSRLSGGSVSRLPRESGRREAGDQISWRGSARGQKCRVSAPVSLYDDGVDASRSSHGILCERSRER